MMDPVVLLGLWLFCIITVFIGVWQMSNVMNEASTISFGFGRCGRVHKGVEVGAMKP